MRLTRKRGEDSQVKDDIGEMLDALARVDVGCALAETARALRYVRPVFTPPSSGEIKLRVVQGRHPVSFVVY